MKIRSILLLLLLIGGAFALNVSAQSGYGYSLLENYQNEYQNQRMYIESGTILDYNYAYYYDPGLEADIYKNSYNFLHQPRVIAYGYSGIVRYLDTEAAYDDVFRLHTDHYVGAYRYYNTSQGPRYVDYWGLNYYSGSYPSPYGFLQGPTGYYSYRIYKVATTQVQLTVPRPPLHLESIDQSGLPPGSNYLTILRGSGLFGTGQSVQVSGSGVTVRVRPNQQPNTIEVLEVEIDIDENAARGDRQLTLTVNGATSNAINFRVGDRSPIISGITPAEGNTGDNVNVTISGSAFGFNPQLLVDGAGVQATILNSSTTQIQAVMSVATATYIGDRGVMVKSRGLTGNGFQQVPGTSDTSNAVPFRVLEVIVGIPDIPVVEKYGEQTISVNIGGLVDNNQVKFTLEPLQGASGAAQFDNNSNEITRGNGTHSLKIRGVTESSAANQMTLRARVVGSDADVTHKEFTVATINSLTFQKFAPDYIDLDQNPGVGLLDAGGQPYTKQGLRIYPDKKDVVDVANSTDRSLIKVRATILPAIPNVKINFKTFDLDDPSAASTPIDTTGSSGNDNNGTVTGGTRAGLLSGNGCATSTDRLKDCSSDSNGIYEATLKLTIQPGDNFAVAASLTDTYLSNITFNGTDGTKLVDGANKLIPISSEANSDSVPAVRTSMLTVWRKVHFEGDSMQNVTGNSVTGTVTDTKKVSNGTQTLNLSVMNLEPDRFDGGTMTITHGTITRTFKVLSVTYDTTTTPPTIVTHANTASAVTFSNNAGAFNVVNGDSFTLYDDDDFNDNEGTTLRGDEGEVMPAPDTSMTSLIYPTDNPCSDVLTSYCNVFASAYTKPIYDLPNATTKVPFVLNLPMSVDITQTGAIPAEVQAAFRFDNSTLSDMDQFWAVYFTSAYQIDERFDGDPNGSQNVLGITDSLVGSGQGCLLFLENTRVREGGSRWNTGALSRNYTMAHELGHKFGGIHTDLGLMAQSSTRTSGIFSDITLNRMRGGLVNGSRLTHP